MAEIDITAEANFQPKNILVPVDFSPLSHKALTYAQAFAEAFGAVVHLVHAAEPLLVMAGIDAVGVPIDDPKQLAELQHRLGKLAKELPQGSVGRTFVRPGYAVDEVTSVAKELSIDLIVLSTHGHSGIQRVFFGSTAEGILRKAACDVLVLRPKQPEFIDTASAPEKRFSLALKSILVPIDFSDLSRKALGYAVTFARRFQAKLICVHIIDIPPYTGPEPMADLELIRKGAFAATERTLEEFVKDVTVQIPRENVLTYGSASREIIQLAEDRNVELIIMGTHGKRGLTRFLMGSTSERVVRHARTPVLIVKQEKES